MPFAVVAREGVLTLTLDTPGSPINVFNHQTAHQLKEILAGIDPKTTRAIVFETAKPNSFINGVGLLLAHASRSSEDIERASVPPWEAYRAVREAPVPTIAVVRGNCFGCGVEFILHCDYRIAADTCETQFYMTELHDYLFIPLFGSTWNLPHAVGLGDAIDLLLWGERWDAGRARDRGLIDAVCGDRGLAVCSRDLIAEVGAGRRPLQRRAERPWGAHEDRIVAGARARIAALPKAYQQVYGQALQLLIDGARRTRGYLEHQREELRCSAASALSPHGKAAYSFFYLRQMAAERAAGRYRGPEPPARLVAAAGDDRAASEFTANLLARKLAADGEAAPRPTFRLVGATNGPSDGAAGAEDVADVDREVVVEPAFTTMVRGAVNLYAPWYRSDCRLLELVVAPSPEPPSPELKCLSRTLQRLGFEVALTRPTRAPVSSALLIAYFTPLLRFVGHGGQAAIVNAELRAMGFVRLPAEVLASVGDRALAAPMAEALRQPVATIEAGLGSLRSATGMSPGAAPEIVDALSIALLEVAAGARARREVRDACIVDLIARELLDFPRHLSSLCSWLKRERIGAALARAGVESLVTGSALAVARSFVDAGREFYR